MENGLDHYIPFRLWALVILILFLMNNTAYCRRLEPIIKIGITPSTPWSLKLAGGYEVYYRGESGEWTLIKDWIDQGRYWTVFHEGQRLVVVTDLGDRIVSDYPLCFVPIAETARLILNGRVYPGKLELWPKDKRLLEEEERAYVYNYVPLEEYVQCVLASEAYPEWNHQALAAQAVAIRSYTLYNLGKHREYDFCDQAHCQKYLGIFDNPAFAAAVTETQGEVLTWAGRVINAVYHSSSGGHTKNNEDVWGGDPLPYLRGVTDFDQGGKNYRWKQTPFFKVAEFGRKLDLEGSGGLIITPRFNGVSMLNGFICQQTKGKVCQEFTNEELRRIFALPSRNFQLYYFKEEDLTEALQADRLVGLGTAEIEGGYVTFQADLDLAVFSRRIHEPVTLSADEYLLFIGNGAGHGVGLSQWGAQAMGEQGHTYQAILKYFYGKLPQLIRLE